MAPNLEHFPDLLAPPKGSRLILFFAQQSLGSGLPEHEALIYPRVTRCGQGTCPASLLIVPVLCPNLAPTPSCRHSEQERDGISAAPHLMCFGSASQEGVPPASFRPRWFPRGLDPGAWLVMPASLAHRVATSLKRSGPGPVWITIPPFPHLALGVGPTTPMSSVWIQ